MKHYRGKVRDTYTTGHQIALVASDRISAFDVILPDPIPMKGAVLNRLSAYFLNHTRHIAPNWLTLVPHPQVSIGMACEQIPIEIIVRGYITGSMWRAYERGARTYCGQTLVDGLKNFDQLPHPIITPTTKAAEGHDENTSQEEILRKGIVSNAEWEQIANYALSLFAFGSQFAAARGLILADTKFEFGRDTSGNICVIDEILTPDSSRYFITQSYIERSSDQAPEQLSKEFVRQWLIDNGFMGLDGQKVPKMSRQMIETISERYISLYEILTGETFDRNIPKLNLDDILKLLN